MITLVTSPKQLEIAAKIHSISWQASHAAFCTPEFLVKHDIPHQLAYLKDEIAMGKTLYMLTDTAPVAIVTLYENLIENLYVLPDKQGMGYGTRLLRYAMDLCQTPTLQVLDNNVSAIALYQKIGFTFTGQANAITETLSEIEMVYLPK